VTDSTQVAVTVTLDPNRTVHIATLKLEPVPSRAGTSARAIVTIVDQNGTPAPGVSVAGRWSGLATGTASATTDTKGTATFTSKATKKHGTFTFQVTGVSGAGYSYDQGKNVAASASLPN
jgi:hypothetical protein